MAGTVVGDVGRSHRVARRLDADQHVVVVAVVAALELEDLLATGEAAGHPDRVHGRLGARVAEADEVDAEALLDLLGQRDAVLDREGVAGAIGHAALQRLGHQRVRMAGGQHAEGHVEVDVLVAVRVPDPRAARIGHEQRVRVVGLERAGHAQRHRALGAHVQLGAARGARPVRRLLPLPHRSHALAVQFAPLSATVTLSSYLVPHR